MWDRNLAARPHERKGYLLKARSWLRRNRRVAGDGRVGRIAGCRRLLVVAPVLGVGVGVGAAVAGPARLLLVLAVVRVPVPPGVAALPPARTAALPAALHPH